MYFFSKRKQNNILLVPEAHVKKNYKGNKPDFHQAMKTNQAKELYEKFLLKLGQVYDPSKIKGKKKNQVSDLGKNVSKKFKRTWDKGLVYED